MISLSCQADLHVWCHFTKFVQYKCILWLREFFEIPFKRPLLKTVDYSQHPWVPVWLSQWICCEINESTRLPTLKNSRQTWCKPFYKIMYHNTGLLLLDTSWFYNKIKLRLDNSGIRLSLVLVARSALITAGDCSLMTENSNLQCIKLKEQCSWSLYLGHWSVSRTVCQQGNRVTVITSFQTNIAISSFYLELLCECTHTYICIYIWLPFQLRL